MRLLVLLGLLTAPLSAQQAPDSTVKRATTRSVTVEVTDSAIVRYFTVRDTVWDTLDVTPPPDTTPKPPVGRVYFSADAESGTLAPWPSWGTISCASGIKPTVSTARVRSGRYAYKYEIPANPPSDNCSMTQANNPTPSMGGRSGHFTSGWYSFWLYIDSGFDQPGWKMLIGWQTGVSGRPSPISHFELQSIGGKAQLVYVLKNCAVRLYTCPTIPGYSTNGGYYQMTAQSPRGVVEFPRGRWVHLSFYYKMSPTHGAVEAWQDGERVMDLTAPTMNTFAGHSIAPMTNAAGDLNIQFGPYGQPQSKVQRMYVDEFQVTDYRVAP